MKTNNHTKERVCYILEETFNYLITILVSGSYLAKVTSTLGFSDGLTAILSSLSSLCCSVQLLSVAIFRKGKVKRRITAMFLLNQILFVSLYLTPFFPIPHGVRTVLFICFMLLGYFCLNVMLPPRINWYMSYVDDRKRGAFTAKKEAISLVSGIVFQFCMGAIIDHWEAKGNIRAALITCAIVISLLSVAHTLSLLFTQDADVPEHKRAVRQEFKAILSHTSIRPILVLSALWAISHSISIPFYGTYTIKELGFSMSFIAFLSLLGAISRILASMFLGKYADKYSFAKMLLLCYGIVALGFAAAAFTRPSNGHILYPIYSVLNAISMGGINSGEINLVFDYVSPQNRTAALSVRNTIYGVTGFLTATAVTPLLNHIQNNGNQILGIPLYAQQVLSIIACICTILTAIYLRQIILKLPKNNQVKETDAI